MPSISMPFAGQKDSASFFWDFFHEKHYYLCYKQSKYSACLHKIKSNQNFSLFNLNPVKGHLLEIIQSKVNSIYKKRERERQMSKERPSQQWKSEKKSYQKNREKYQKSKQKSERESSIPTVVFMIVSDEEGAVYIPYQVWAEPIKGFIKQHGGVWCPVFKVWKTSRVELEFIKRDLPTLLSANYQEPPTFVKLSAQPLTDILCIKGIKYEKIDFNLEEHPLYHRLYPFQRETMNFCINRHGRILIADEMGIGKSVQSLACNLLFHQPFPLLIICPSSLKHVWRDEIAKWYKEIISSDQVIVVKKSSLKPGQLDNAKVVIVSYEISSKLTQQLAFFSNVICDEAHYLKNPETNRCSQLLPFLIYKKRIFLLTGTPALSKPKELFNLLRILRPDIFTRLDQFGERYCEKKQNPWSHRMQYDGAKNLAELHYLLKKTVMIRRLKCQVLSDLPSKQRQIIYMQTQKAVTAEIKDILKSKFSVSTIRQSEKLMEFFGKKEVEQGQSIMRCYMLSATAKLHSVKEYISSILENDIKVIIFAHHKFVMDQLENHLTSLKYLYVRMDGDVNPETRKKKVDLFQQDSNIKVALLSVTAMGTGFTLTAASTVIFAELHWTPAVLIQAEDRAHRIGQKYSVNIHYLIGDNTLDPIMLRQLQRKTGTVGKVLDGQSQSLNIEIVQKGELGSFQIPALQVKSKNTKITDYFQRLPPKPQSKQQMPVLPQQTVLTQKMQDQSCQQFVQGVQQKNISNQSDSDQSFMLQFLRRKRQSLNLAPK